MKIKYEYLFVIILALVGAAAWVTFSKKIPLKQGLDIKGGIRLVLQADTSKLEDKAKLNTGNGMQEQLIRIIEKRVNSLGVAEAVVQPKGSDQIIVELPDVKDEKMALDYLQSTAQLEFRWFRDIVSTRNPMARYRMETSTDSKGEEVYTFTDTRNGQRALTADEVQKEIIEKSPLVVSGADLLPKSQAQPSANSASWVVNLQFNDKGTKAFGDFTRFHQQEIVAIILDGKILMAPEVRDPILNGRAEISGNMDTQDAVSLSNLLNAGSLPAPLKVAQIQRVDATLGQDAVKSTEQAGIVGLVLVLIFMLLYYRLPGFLADLALVFYTLFSIAVFKLIPVTLTLPGMAGFILSIGMAVDANILIFERLKEELRSGKTLKAAVDAGFGRAWGSIRDSNICSLITAAILLQFGTGPIKGFAFTLGLGVLISMFTAITVTRTMLHLLIDFQFTQKPWLYGLGVSWVSRKDGRWLNVIGRRNIYFAISGILVVGGLVFLSMGGLKKGIDFTGGSVVQVQFAPDVRTDMTKVRQAASSAHEKIESIQASDNNTYFLRAKKVTMAQYKDLVAHMSDTIGTVKTSSFDYVGPTVSKELTVNALWAIFFSSLLIILYLTYQFRTAEFATGFKYGMSAIIATLHDVLVLVGVFAALGYFLNWEVDSLFVTAVLTVIGFSTHDTIVIFDRIRENWKHREKDEVFEHAVNRSILQTFARSINTSFTVILTLAALLVMGGATVKLLVVALLVGVVSGTYSSIFNASPILVVWEGIANRKKQAQKPGELKAMVSNVQVAEAPKPKPVVKETVVVGNGTSAAGEDDVQKDKAKAKAKRKRRF